MGNAGYGNHTEDTEKDVELQARRSRRKARPASTARSQPPASMPAAGPHDKPHLTNPDATPGTGSLPECGRPRRDEFDEFLT